MKGTFIVINIHKPYVAISTALRIITAAAIAYIAAQGVTKMPYMPLGGY